MKVSLAWVKQFTDIDISTDILVKKIGEQLGAVEEVIELGPKYNDVIITEVVSCEKHPDADKLSVCMINDGGVVEGVERTDGLVQVVCGAPNVKAGIKVAWLPPGATVPSTYDTDPFVLGARELRGKMSNGMLASMKELSIGDEHDGILEVDVPAEVGQKFADVYQLNDTIIDIENKMFTHRPDCFGQLGVAREIAGISHKRFVSPEWYLQPLDRIKPGSEQLPLAVQNDIPDLVPRFVVVPIRDVTVGKSPVIIQSFLARVGIKPINNIVDITNYLMVLTGQPLHAYDYDKVASRTDAEGAVIKARHGDGNSELKLLNGKTTVPGNFDMVIATDSQVIGIGGVMGGADTEVDDSTKNIILECANFDMYKLRKTSMSLGLFTDAVSRFNKGQSPLQNDTILEEAIAMVQSLAGGEVAGGVQDARGEVEPIPTVEITSEFVSRRLGQPVQADDIAELLQNVEFDSVVDGDTVRVTPPFWRTDIEIREDIVEEVGRLLGFHHLPAHLPMRSMQPVEKDKLLSTKSAIRSQLAAAGANELLTYSFVHGKLIQAVGQDSAHAFKVTNALSPDLQFYRMSLTPSLLDKVYANIRAGYDTFALFEIGKTHIKGHVGEDNLPKEEERVACVYVSNASSQPAYYFAKKQLDELLDQLGIKGVRYEVIDHEFDYETGRQTLAPFDQSRTAVVKLGDSVLGVVGEFSSNTRKALKLPAGAAGFEISTSVLMKSNKFTSYSPLSKFPSVSQDITLKVAKDSQFGSIYSVIRDSFEVSSDYTWRLVPLDIYENADAKHYSFRLTIASHEKTLKTEEVNSMLNELAERVGAQTGAVRL